MELDRWLGGTTCSHHLRRDDHRCLEEDLRVLMMNESKGVPLWLLKHRGHTEYLDRFSGSTRCGTYYCLYDLDNIEHGHGFTSGFGYGEGYIKKWEGRWTKAREEEMWKIIKDYLNDRPIKKTA